MSKCCRGNSIELGKEPYQVGSVLHLDIGDDRIGWNRSASVKDKARKKLKKSLI
ncbi:protein of unknown function [Paenibacillus alvei]|uniref:Uncharacterized protein n=1 Tax=Paenibacillus alvei TaxID=44250 RepID=A0A383RB46_PAEAL|nr:protein of unknown function [Paenibacillus alvei]